MEFRFHCFVVRHVSDRVTVVPLELPALALHAPSLERAVEDLTLALDDRISRAHPRRIALFARPGGGELVELEVPALRVWGERETLVRPLRLSAVVAPAHRPFVEVRAVRPDLRVWLPGGDDLAARAADMLRTHLARLPDDALLALRPEGAESLTAIVLDAAPTRLSALRFRELELDERPPPRPRERDDDDDGAEDEARGDAAGGDEPAADADDTQGGDGEHDPDGFDDDVAGARRSRSAASARRKRRKRVPTPTLDRIGVPLHALARADALDRAYEVDELAARVLERLDARHPDPLVLVGPAGVGKTALLHEVAARMAAPDAPPAWRARRFVFADASRLIAGEGFFGDWQQQTLDALDEARRGDVVLHLGHAVELIDAGKSAHSDQNVAQLIAGLLAAREVRVVAEASPEEWARLERRNLGFAQLWSVLRVDEPPAEVTARVLAHVARELGEDRGVRVEPDAVSAAAALARRFWPYGSHLGNTVRFVRRLIDARAGGYGGRAPAAWGRPRPQTPGATRVTGHDATELFSSESGIPPVLLRDDVPLEPATVRAFLRARVMGQDGAVERATEVVAVIKAGLSDLRRPIAVLFFAGPTGVGKTELSKALAEFVFGSRERLVRLDMGEYAGPDALARLIGDPGAPGHLTGAVRRQPFCVVLLDEIEKAHPAVFDALLGVLGEGRLTDAEGRFTDFRNAVIIMTSNLGAETLRARVGFGRAGGDGGATARDRAADEAAAREVRQHYVAEAERFFRPELINRIDDFVVFAPLGADVIRAIVSREVAMVARREGLRRHEVALAITDAALSHLAARGFDPRYGARPLKRAIERELVAPIGAYLATHPRGGPTRLSVDAPPGGPAGAPAALAFRAATLGAGDDATGRAAAMELLEDAAALRGEVRRWSRSQLARALGRSVAMFDKVSRLPGFWSERGLADRTAAHAAAARAVLEGFAEVSRQAEAAEDLAFEVYYDRGAQDLASLRLELAAARRAFVPLQEQLYNTLYPPRTGAVLYLAAARGAWSWALWLLRAYRGWCDERGLVTRTFTPTPAPEPAPSGAHKRRGAARGDEGVARPLWEANDLSATVTHPLVALAIEGTTGGGQMLLAAEHGAHRFTEGGATSLVRVRFEPRFATRAEHLPDPGETAGAMPDDEVRRIAPGKGSLKDARTGTEHHADAHGFDLAGLLAAWMRYRVFGGEAEPWS